MTRRFMLSMSLSALFSIPTQAVDRDISPQLEATRKNYDLPALAAVVFDRQGIVAQGVSGVRKKGASIKAELTDPWHLGSETKAMMATLVGVFVARGTLSWDSKVITYFPGIALEVDPRLRDITIGDLLSHRAGLTANLPWAQFDQSQDIKVQRRQAARNLLMASPEFPPGTYHYSNAGYVLVGAVLEKITGQSWERLMEEKLFRPLGMKGAGFGGTGHRGKLDAPWGHFANGHPVKQNGPAQDNPPVMGPAGRVHAPADDWAKFLIDQLRGAVGQDALLPASIYRDIQSPQFEGNYGYGWAIVRPPWAQGRKVLTHAGSNTMNYAVCWLAVEQGFGVLLCTNQSGPTATRACREIGQALIQEYKPAR